MLLVYLFVFRVAGALKVQRQLELGQIADVVGAHHEDAGVLVELSEVDFGAVNQLVELIDLAVRVDKRQRLVLNIKHCDQERVALGAAVLRAKRLNDQELENSKVVV